MRGEERKCRQTNQRKRQECGTDSWLKLAIRNVQGIYEERAVKYLEMVATKYKNDFLALQERHTKKSQVTELENIYFP